MGISGVTWVSLLFQALIALANIKFGKYKVIRKAQPEWLQDIVVWLLLIVSGICTAAKQPLFPSTWPVALVAGLLLFLGILAPLLGRAENLLRRNGSGIIFEEHRFRGHLLTNFLGASAAGAFFWAAHSVPGFIDFTHQFKDASAFNIVLPLTTVVAFAFVRQQQIAKCPDLDELVADKADWKSGINGYSLSDWNQLSNCIYLIASTFMATSTILYLFAFSLLQAKHSDPVAFSPQLALAIVAFLAFLLACGSPWSWDNRTVYFTFLTGTPGALIATMIWLSLLQPSPARNVFAVPFVGIGYAAYCGATVLGVMHGRRAARDAGASKPPESAAPDAKPPESAAPVSQPPSETLELHYFAAAILGIALTIMLGVLYLSNS